MWSICPCAHILGSKCQNYGTSPISTTKYMFHIFSIHVVRKVELLFWDSYAMKKGTFTAREHRPSTKFKIRWPLINQWQIVVFSWFSDKQQSVRDSDSPSAGDQGFGPGAEACPREPARTEAAGRVLHQESHPVPKDSTNQFPHWWVMFVLVVLTGECLREKFSQNGWMS